MVKFFSSLLIILIASILQFIFIPNNIIINFIIATLIIFSFIFLREDYGFLKLLFFVILGTFLINWYPILTFDILVYALIPIFIYLFSKKFLFQSLFCVIISLVLGFFALYLLIEPSFIVNSFNIFLLDTLISSSFGLLVFISMDNIFKKTN
jgi:hypothetical protein